MAVKILTAFLLLLVFPAKAFAAFSVENITPTEITSPDQELTLFVTASNLSSSTQYLQAAITKDGQSNYFGFTQNNSGNWVQYQSSPDLNSLLAFTPVGGNWNGEVQAKIDTSDSGFAGPGTYQIKLLKYISSSGTSSNSLPLTINIVSSQPTLPPTPSQAPTLVQQKFTPVIDFSLPTSLFVGQEFEIPFALTNFEPGSYSVKARIGKDVSHLTLGQTFNSAWLGDTDSWSKFPQVSGGSKIKARLSPNAEAGDYKIKLSLKKGDDSPILSEEKSASFKANPNPPSTSTNSKTSKTPTPSQAPKTGAVLATATKTSTIEAQINEHLKSVDLLATLSGVKKNPVSKRALNLLLPEKKEEFPVAGALGTVGLALTLGTGVYLLKRKVSQDE